RDLREAALPRVRAGRITIPRRRGRGLTRVIVRLAAPPLAAWNAERTLASASRAHHLDLRTSAAVAYRAELRRQQETVAAAVLRAIPQARVQERYDILLDGFALQLPTRSLPALVRVRGVTKVYPSLAYHATMDRGPSVIHATD